MVFGKYCKRVETLFSWENIIMLAWNKTMKSSLKLTLKKYFSAHTKQIKKMYDFSVLSSLNRFFSASLDMKNKALGPKPIWVSWELWDSKTKTYMLASGTNWFKTSNGSHCWGNSPRERKLHIYGLMHYRTHWKYIIKQPISL